jgi:outer membrane protein
MKLITKPTFLLIVMLCLSGLVSAQTVGKGAWMLGGSLGFSSTKVKDADVSTTHIFLNPNVGYFIMDDLALGLDIAFFSESTDGESESNFGFGPYARYYITDPIFLQVGYAFDASPFDSQLFQAGGGSTFHAAVGYSWFLNNGVAIEPALFLNIYSDDEDSALQSFTQFGLSIGIQAFANHDHGME